MTQLEIEVKKRYGISRGDDTEETSGIDMQRAQDYIDGYHQAEKDLELSWEDIRELHIIFDEVDVEIDFYKTDIKTETLGYYQEVLKRFKERKEK